MNNFTIEERLKYYMGKYYNKKYKIKVKSNYIKNRNSFIMLEPMFINLEYLLKSFQNNKLMDVRKAYVKPFIDLLKNMDNKYKKKFFLYLWGDISHDPEIDCIICKTRPLNNNSVIIQKLEIDRHWIYLTKIKKLDIDYKIKKNMCIWRGGTTGYRRRQGSRYTLVPKFFNSKFADIGFSEVIQDKQNYKVFLKNKVSIKDHLKFKFIISCEGNDVASGLKWQLYSNSVVLMTKPTTESWAMERFLQPFVHYIPLSNDYSDLEEKYKWCLNNEDKCIQISKNATNYIEQFLDEEKEMKIRISIMEKYFDNIEFKLDL
jgi:hypothetical protein